MKKDENFEESNLNNQIKLNDLLEIDGQQIDISNNIIENPMLAVVKEDIENLLNKQTSNNNVINKNYNVFESPKFSKKLIDLLNIEKSSVAIRKEKLVKAEFEKKMNRLNKIKSKKAKRTRRLLNNNKEKEKLMESMDLSSTNTNDSEELDVQESVSVVKNSIVNGETNPLFCFENKNVENQQLISEMFNDNSDDSFELEKKNVVEDNQPRIEKTILHGWGVWGGDGAAEKKTRQNTICEYKKGIMVENRKDFESRNVIINENIKYDTKYSAGKIYHTDNSTGRKYIKTKKVIKQQKPTGFAVLIRKYQEKEN